MPKLDELVPGGCHTYSKGDDRFPRNAPIIARGQGGTVWDREGHEYVDWGMGINNVLIGHAEREIDEAVIDAIGDGQNFSRPTVLEEEAAAVVSEHFGAEMIKFCKNGSDANNAAIRLARAISGRQHIAFDGAAPFFSTADWFCAHQARWSGTLDAERAFSHQFTFNDVDSLERVFARRNLACVVLELCRAKRPSWEFLRALIELCSRDGTLLIVDEVVTGYRYALRGMAHELGIDPDLTTIGKGLGNGHSVSALMGKREYMRRGASDVFLLSTTHGAEQHGLAAAIAVTKFYQREPVISRLARTGFAFAQIVGEAAAKSGAPIRVDTDYDCRPVLVVPSELEDTFYTTVCEHGVLLPKAWVCPCYRRTEEELEITRAAIEAACRQVVERAA